MAVRKTKNGRWQADVTIGKKLDGSRDRPQPTFRTKREAEKEEQKLKTQKEIRRGKSYGGILLSEFIEDYYWPQKKKLKPSTIKGYKRDIKLRILPAFGNMPVEDISRYYIQEMIDKCATKKIATNARETLSSILRLAQEMELIPVNPAGFTYQYPDESKQDDEAFGVWLSSFEEIKEVLDFLEVHHEGEPVHRICVLGLCHGLRKGEIIAAHTDNIHLKERFIWINETCTEGEGGLIDFGEPKTPRSIRSVPIIKLSYPWLKEWKKEGGYIVKDKHGDHLTPRATRYALEKVFDHGEFDDGRPLPRITPFSLRHSFATACVNADIDVTKLFPWMGHADMHTTQQYYVKQKLKDLNKDAELIDKLI